MEVTQKIIGHFPSERVTWLMKYATSKAIDTLMRLKKHIAINFV